jgi:hypothetical protein
MRSHILTAASVAAIVACISLIALAVIPRPPFSFSHSDILSGRQTLNAHELASYLVYLKRNLTIDSVYLLGHVGMWLGFGTLLQRRGGRGGLIIVLGLISGALDLMENEIRWAIAPSLPSSASASWTVAWEITVGMSFWALLITTLLAIMQLWSQERLDRIICLIGLGCIPGICLIYFSGYLLTFIWMIIWHGMSAIYLWKSAGIAINPREGNT